MTLHTVALSAIFLFRARSHVQGCSVYPEYLRLALRRLDSWSWSSWGENPGEKEGVGWKKKGSLTVRSGRRNQRGGLVER